MYVCSDKFQKTLDSPLSKQVWISSDLFIQSIACIVKPKKNLFSFIKIKSTISTRVKTLAQTALFFFRVLCGGQKELPVENLLDVFFLSRKMKRISALIMTRTVLENLQQRNHITINEFFDQNQLPLPSPNPSGRKLISKCASVSRRRRSAGT